MNNIILIFLGFNIEKKLIINKNKIIINSITNIKLSESILSRLPSIDGYSNIIKLDSIKMKQFTNSSMLVINFNLKYPATKPTIIESKYAKTTKIRINGIKLY